MCRIRSTAVIDSGLVAGRGIARAEDAQGTPTQSHIPPNILVHEDYLRDHHAALLLVHPRVVQLLPHLRVGHSVTPLSMVLDTPKV